jgi:hypothetical protein
MTVTEELTGILSSAQTLAASAASAGNPPTISTLIPSDQALLDQTATVVGAPTSTGSPVPVTPTPASS